MFKKREWSAKISSAVPSQIIKTVDLERVFSNALVKIFTKLMLKKKRESSGRPLRCENRKIGPRLYLEEKKPFTNIFFQAPSRT